MDRDAVRAGAVDRQLYRGDASFQVAQHFFIGDGGVRMRKGLADVPGQEGVRFGFGAAQIGLCAGRAAGVRGGGKIAFAIERVNGDPVICRALQALNAAALQRL